MQCTIYALGEKKRRVSLDRVLVVARKGEELILHRDELNALWELPEKALVRGESRDETARAALGEAIGEAVFDVSILCAYTITGEDGDYPIKPFEDSDVHHLPDVGNHPSFRYILRNHEWKGEE